MSARREAMPTIDKGIKSIFHYDSDGTVTIQQRSDVTGILRANHFQQSEQTMRHQGEVMNHVARIDMLAIKNWMNARGIFKNWWYEFNQDPKLLREFLNDPDNKCWRTRLGKI